MNFKEYSNTPQIISKLLSISGIIEYRRLVIQIDNELDYNISDYKREIETDYFFQNYWHFKPHFQILIEAKFIKNFVFHFDDLKRASNELGIYFDGKDYITFINKIPQAKLDEYSFPTEWNEFKFRQVRSLSIDNIKQNLHYEGSFFGNYADVNPLDWGIYSLLDLIIIPLLDFPFYKQLIGESYILYIEGKYKLSYFIAYSAFESFINYHSNDDHQKERLKDKLNKLFSRDFPKLETHQIYSSMINQFDTFSILRNHIAHGNQKVELSKKEVSSILSFVLTVTCSYDLKLKTFKGLKQAIQSLDTAGH